MKANSLADLVKMASSLVRCVTKFTWRKGQEVLPESTKSWAFYCQQADRYEWSAPQERFGTTRYNWGEQKSGCLAAKQSQMKHLDFDLLLVRD
jgi:hypothetical protein